MHMQWGPVMNSTDEEPVNWERQSGDALQDVNYYGTTTKELKREAGFECQAKKAWLLQPLTLLLFAVPSWEHGNIRQDIDPWWCSRCHAVASKSQLISCDSRSLLRSPDAVEQPIAWSQSHAWVWEVPGYSDIFGYILMYSLEIPGIFWNCFVFSCFISMLITPPVDVRNSGYMWVHFV